MLFSLNMSSKVKYVQGQIYALQLTTVTRKLIVLKGTLSQNGLRLLK